MFVIRLNHQSYVLKKGTFDQYNKSNIKIMYKEAEIRLGYCVDCKAWVFRAKTRL